MGRRERLRAQTLREIEDASFAIIDEDGVHALSIAALARRIAMSTLGLPWTSQWRGSSTCW